MTVLTRQQTSDKSCDGATAYVDVVSIQRDHYAIGCELPRPVRGGTDVSVSLDLDGLIAYRDAINAILRDVWDSGEMGLRRNRVMFDRMFNAGDV